MQGVEFVGDGWDCGGDDGSVLWWIQIEDVDMRLEVLTKAFKKRASRIAITTTTTSRVGGYSSGEVGPAGAGNRSSFDSGMVFPFWTSLDACSECMSIE